MNKNLTNQLQQLGLTSKEAEVYLTLLQLGPSSVLEISRHCDVKRATIYNILESLTQKGLSSLELDGFKNHYTAAPPKNFDQLIQSQKNILEACLPELERLQSVPENKNLISQYKSEGISLAYDRLYQSLTPSGDYLVFGDIQGWYDSNPEIFKSWPKRRSKIVDQSRAIYTDTPKAREYRKQETNIRMEIKLLPKKSEMTAIKVITSDLVFVHQTIVPFSIIVIENPPIVNLYKEMFNNFWDLL